MIRKKRRGKLNSTFDPGGALTVDALLQLARSELEPVSDTPRLDAEVLMRQVLRTSAAGLIARGGELLDRKTAAGFRRLVARRRRGEPVAYITGEREFWSMSLHVTPDTLIPRPETERLVELALERIPARADWTIVDLGTGSGAIALAIASERPNCRVIATDRSLAALAVAQDNAQKHHLRHIRFVHADWLDFKHDRQYSMILSNPPYIEKNDPHLCQGDVRFEPHTALVSPQQGLADIRKIAQQSLTRLVAGGYLLVECGYRQGEAVVACMQDSGYDKVLLEQDTAGRDRVAIGQKTA